MKSKHRGLAATLILIICVFISIGYAWNYFQSDPNEIVLGAPMAPVQINVPNSEEVAFMRQQSSKLEAFSLPNGFFSGPVSLELFGYQRPEVRLEEDAGETDGASDKIPHLLTFTFSSGKRRFCIIDSAFYSQGEILPNGEQIVNISAHRVLIRKNDKQFWIPLAAPDDLAGNQTKSQSLSNPGKVER